MIRVPVPEKVTEKTLIPLSLMITVMGLVYWTAGVAASAEQAKQGLQGCSLQLQSIDQRLSRIEGKLDKDLKGDFQ